MVFKGCMSKETKRLDVNDPNVFDKWRALYYDLTLEEQEQFGRDMEEKYPHQQSYTLSNFEHLFNRFPGCHVLEIGGWKGELADTCLKKFDIKGWHNIDYCRAAVEKSICHPARYSAYCPSNFFWFKGDRSHMADIAIAAHVIEHLTDEDCFDLMRYLNGISRIMFEAPIAMNGETTWDGYIGTHILKMGWDKICDHMKSMGYSVEQINPHCFLFTKI